MNKTLVNKIISELRDELKSLYPDFKGIYLFGSYARGTAVEDSDIDLALVFDREIDWRFKDTISNIVWLEMIKYFHVIDSFTISKKELKNPKTPFRNNIIREGIFYGAG